MEVSNVEFETLKTRIANLQEELSDLNQVLDGWAEPVPADSSTPSAQPPKRRLRNIQVADKEPLRKAFDEIFERLGIEDTGPVGVEELHRRQLEDGINPEDCILSRGIIEMREE
ncbi:MAG: hypothetical protein M3Y56_07560 [Armatimonadota bacterium]|nr:hypothetical protein [Armatimonadota bacterium]